MLKDAGYATLAFHGFSEAMFSRPDWYPQIGLDERYFLEQLAPDLAGRCGGTFRGACDADLAAQISRRAAQTSAPRLIYWLTLNTHVPIAPTDARTDFNCGDPASKFGTMAVCRMAELWHDVFAAVADLALDPAIGPAEILIVGDHSPPLWSKRDRSRFEPGQVAWYRLTPKEGPLLSRVATGELASD
jgi:phosphoglycerol transferase MdoB-like AlkP superfamily enzyme